MTMSHDGLTKLIEEASEVIQVAAKAQALGSLGTHWDGTNLKERLEDELGDLRAAARFVQMNYGLDLDRIAQRATSKLVQFEKWHALEADPVVDPQS